MSSDIACEFRCRGRGGGSISVLIYPGSFSCPYLGILALLAVPYLALARLLLERAQVRMETAGR